MWIIKKDVGGHFEEVQGITFRDAEQAGATAMDWTIRHGITYVIVRVKEAA